jgi:hypothetical protein
MSNKINVYKCGVSQYDVSQKEWDRIFGKKKQLKEKNETRTDKRASRKKKG